MMSGCVTKTAIGGTYLWYKGVGHTHIVYKFSIPFEIFSRPSYLTSYRVSKLALLHIGKSLVRVSRGESPWTFLLGEPGTLE